jgi:hypothetical protein
VIEGLAQRRDAGDQSYEIRQATSTVTELAVDETVGLIRVGTRTQVLVAGSALAGFLGSPKGRTLKAAAPGAHDTLSGLLPLLTAAASPSSKGGEDLVLRSWNGPAQQVLEILADTPDRRLGYVELRQQIELSDNQFFGMVNELEGASLVERMNAPDATGGIEVNLTGKGCTLAKQVAGANGPDGDPDLQL